MAQHAFDGRFNNWKEKGFWVAADDDQKSKIKSKSNLNSLLNVYSTIFGPFIYLSTSCLSVLLISIHQISLYLSFLLILRSGSFPGRQRLYFCPSKLSLSLSLSFYFLVILMLVFSSVPPYVTQCINLSTSEWSISGCKCLTIKIQ